MFSQKNHNSKIKLLLPLVMLLATVVACTFEVGVLEPTPTINTDADILDHDLAAIAESDEPEAVQPSPSHAEAACQESQLAGLVFGYGDQDGESLWQVVNCEGLIQLSTKSNLIISPNGYQAVYVENDDIWLVDLLGGSQQNLTNTPDRVEGYPQWWQGHDDLILFGSWGSTDDLGPTAGYLSMVSTDGLDYHILVDQPSNTVPAPLPGGSIIAYDLGDTAWLYNLDSNESELFDINVWFKHPKRDENWQSVVVTGWKKVSLVDWWGLFTFNKWISCTGSI